jgi:DUF2934 family protein
MNSPVVATPGSVQREPDKASVIAYSFQISNLLKSKHNDISLVAYSLWLEHGCPEGTAERDWFEAEQRILAKELCGN